jgi:hypothetical protein
MTDSGGAATERFHCQACGTPLTLPVVRLPDVPEPRPELDFEGQTSEPTMPAGFWAFDTEPATWRPRDQESFDPDEEPGDVARWQPRGMWNCPLLNLSDLLDLPPHPDGLRSSGCCGRDGLDGPNVVCPSCATPVGTVLDDCWTPHEVRLDPLAVIARPASRS